MGLVLLPPEGLTVRSTARACCAARARPASSVDLRVTMVVAVVATRNE